MPLTKQLMLNIRTGEITEVSVQRGISVSNYFNSLNILNKAAHIYGCVYLASQEALRLLNEDSRPY
jgi:hypothetical protein